MITNFYVEEENTDITQNKSATVITVTSPTRGGITAIKKILVKVFPPFLKENKREETAKKSTYTFFISLKYRRSEIFMRQ